MKNNSKIIKIKELLSIFAILFSIMNMSLTKSPLMLVLSYVIHEIGHIFFARILGAQISKISGGVFRLSISYDTKNLSFFKEAIVCAGGIIFNLLFALVISLLNTSNNDTLSTLFVFNVSLALMNLYPISILDGGGILKALILSKIQGGVAEKVIKWMSFFFALLLWLISVYFQIVFSTNISLLFISIYLLIHLCFSI